jgi:hypothetical protein
MAFSDPILAGNVLIREAIQSPNFSVNTEGAVAGWQIAKDGSATFFDVVIGNSAFNIDSQGSANFATVNVSDDLALAGESLTDILTSLPKGIIGYGDSAARNSTGTTLTVNTAVVTGAAVLLEMAVGPLLAARFYRITWSWDAIYTVATDNWRWTVRYTTDGTTPPSNGSIVDGSERHKSSVSGLVGGDSLIVFYSPAADYDVVKFSLTVGRNSGTGTLQLNLTDPNTMLQCVVEDLGLESAALSGGALVQRSKFSGSADPEPVSTYIKTYQCTWSRAWNNSGNDVWSTNDTLVQGYWSGDGQRITWIGFDYSTIISNLSGATVKKVEVYLYYNHWYYNDGGTAIIGTHNSTSTSAPSYDGTKDNQDRKRVSNWGVNVAKWVDITSIVGSEFKTGTSRGIVLGWGPTTSLEYYGKANGNGQTHEPALRITYTK